MHRVREGRMGAHFPPLTGPRWDAGGGGLHPSRGKRLYVIRYQAQFDAEMHCKSHPCSFPSHHECKLTQEHNLNIIFPITAFKKKMSSCHCSC